MVLEDVTELYAILPQTCTYRADWSVSDQSLGSQTKLSKILLNGNNICMVCLAFSTSLPLAR